ncbi:MAG: MopE-related protein [Deltaproteobacteria bacterium]|nr:MopE-related protein [Deltaproteobacteria bacterium]
MNALRAWAMLGLATLALLALPACQQRLFCVNCGDAGVGWFDAAVPPPGDDGGVDPGGDAGVICVPAAETCNGKDDNCNGLIDDGVLVDVGVVCGSVLGVCKQGVTACEQGRLVCQGETPRAPETCNGLDDDCDGVVDNGNPGAGVLCGNGTGECVQGLTMCQAGMIVCEGGTGPTPEVCDGFDNNCDGTIDEGDPGGGAQCGAGADVCVPGKIRCTGGQLVCVGAGPAIAELCNGVDDNCNGQVDEGFNTAIDPNNCGVCGKVCGLPFARAACGAGACQIERCTTDHWDLDRDPNNGCEYACALRGVELCNGYDDDCDGVIDNGVTAPDNCAKLGECAGTKPSCDGKSGWVCRYGGLVSTNGSGQIVPETNCDDRDNDCNGRTDDLFPNRQKGCTAGTGACVAQGKQVCNATHDALICDAPTPAPGSAEICNGIDDDCNGQTDEGAPDAWVTFRVGGATKQIYKYEASHPDATATSIGALVHRSCSQALRLPWINVTYPEAQAACAQAGARLCTETEWQAACEAEAPQACAWSFANSCMTYQPGVCADANYDLDPALPGYQNGLVATGSLASCNTSWGAAGGIYDLSGNVKEWTAARAPGINPLRGGAYNNPVGGATCGSKFVVADDTFLFGDVGFRCCKD